MSGDDKPFILIVEDNAAEAKLLQRTFQADPGSARLACAQSLAEARQILADTPPDLVIADVVLPDGRGTDLLPDEADAATVPVLVLTGQGDEQTAVDAMKRGAIDYVVKSKTTMVGMPGIAARALRAWRYVTERREAKHALERSETTARALLNACPDQALLMNAQGIVLNANPAMAEALSCSSDDVVGRSVYDLLTPDIAMQRKSHVDRLVRTKQPVAFVETHEGSTYDNHLHPLFGDCGEVDRIAMFVRNVTGTKALQEQVRQSDKMHAIGELAGGIAHDFNNLLAGILGEANMLKLEAPAGSATCAAAKTIEEAATKMANLTRQLMGFARRGKYQVVPVDIHATIREAVGLLERGISKDIELTLSLDADAPVVVGDPNQMEQIMLNLAINARDAMPSGGQLTFRTRTVKLDAAFCQDHPDVKPGQFLRIDVTDTGYGIPVAIQERIFDPYFTTKAQGTGTGMGLATVYGIVKNHGGAVDVASTEGAETTFTVFLPCAPEQTVSPTGKEPAAKPVSTRTRVLLVDDEEMLRNVVSRMLRRLNCDVVTAENGKEAVDYYSEHGTEVDLVILDMMMPVMGGRDCFRALMAMDPEVKVLLSTGSALEGQAQEIITEGVLGFVQKPYRLEDLGKQVQEIVGR